MWRQPSMLDRGRRSELAGTWRTISSWVDRCGVSNTGSKNAKLSSGSRKSGVSGIGLFLCKAEFSNGLRWIWSSTKSALRRLDSERFFEILNSPTRSRTAPGLYWSELISWSSSRSSRGRFGVRGSSNLRIDTRGEVMYKGLDDLLLVPLGEVFLAVFIC